MENEAQPVTPITQPTVQTPMSVKPTSNKSNWLKIVLFSVLGLLFLTGAVYAGIQIGKNQTSIQQPTVLQPTVSPTQTAVNPTGLTVTPSPTTDPTADWKTYTNTDFNYSLKLPKECYTPQENNFNSTDFLCKEFVIHILISDYNGTSDEFLATLISKLQSVDSTISTDSIKKVKVNGLDAYYGTYTWEGGGEFYEFIYNHKEIMIDKQPETTPQDKVFDQILSTFKFTN